MRATALIGMAPGIDPALYDHSETEKYGVGNGKYCLSYLQLHCMIFELLFSMAFIFIVAY
jgi:hypothetical protein